MSDYNITLNVVAGGNISPSRFVKGDTTTSTGDLQVLQCSATTDLPVGISGTFTLSLPVANNPAQYEAAAVGDNLLIYPVGATCLLEAGTGGWGPFVFLSPDINGKGIPATSGKYAGAMSLGTVTTAGQLGRVLVLPPQPATAGAAAGLVLSPSATPKTGTSNTITLAEEIIQTDSSSAVVTVTLPTPVGITGKTYIVVDSTGSAATHTVTIATAAGSILPTTAASITANYGVVRLYSNGTNWINF